MLDLGLNAGKKNDAFVKDTDAARFETDVIAASMKAPVIVDFWAPWCGPCKQMMPALEKAVNDAKGAVVMVKVNVDNNPELAQAFRIQSVPMVYAFFQGQPVDGFMGAKSASEIAAFIEKLKKLSGANQNTEEQGAAIDKAAIEKLTADARKFFAEDKFEDAMASWSTILDADPENATAFAGIGWCFVAIKDTESLVALVSEAPEALGKSPQVKGLKVLVDLGTDAPEGEIKTPVNSQQRYDAALQRLRALDIEGAIDMLVDLIKKDREWQEQKAKTLLLSLFDAMGQEHPLTRAGRRKLSAVLFS